MQKYKIIVFFIMVLIVSNVYVYYFAETRTKQNEFINNIAFSGIILKALENNDTSKVKFLLVGDIGRLFIEISSKKNIDIFLPLCQHIDIKFIEQLSQYKVAEKLIKIFPDLKEMREKENDGIMKFKKLCDDEL